MSKYFILHSNCIPVKGYLRSTICDLQNGSVELIPNDLYDILINHIKKSSFDEILNLYSKTEKVIIEEYFQFLLDKKFGFWNHELIPEFIPLSMEWDSPSLISNIIVDLNKNSSIDFYSLNKQIDELGCESMEIRFFDNFTIDYIKDTLNNFSNSVLRSISILIQYTDEITSEELVKLSKEYPRVFLIFISSSPFDKKEKKFNNSLLLYYMKKIILSSSCCGVIKPENFSINVGHFTESMNYNSCLNRKLGIDINGNIKNCPSSTVSFGKFAKTTFKEVINKREFKVIGNIKKDDISVCQDCEFRHICTDCRIYTENNKKYGKPEKCKYNPYEAKWEL